MIVFILTLLMMQHSYASMDEARDRGVAAGISALEKGKGSFSRESSSGYANFKKWGISVNEKFKKTNNPKQLEKEASETFRSDKTALLIQKSHQTREMVQVDLDHLELDNEGLIKNMGDVSLEANSGFEIKTCRTLGESYNSVCKRQRIVKLRIVPETKTAVSYCPGHERKERQWHGHFKHWTEYCGGCSTREVIVPKKVKVTKEVWVGCEAEDKRHKKGLCELVDETLGPLNETRMIDGEEVTRNYWETTRLYKCGSKRGAKADNCDTLKALKCVHQSGNCIKERLSAGGARVCLVFEHKYKCPASNSYSQNGMRGLPKGYCMTGDCIKTTKTSNNNMLDALSKLEALNQIQKTHQKNPITIFAGEPKSCTTNFGGSFKDCCGGMDGIGLTLNLARKCSAEEFGLAEARGKKACVFVGQRKKNKTLDINFSRQYVYCCFPTKLGRLFQEQGRKQLGLVFGSPKNPDCRGLTLHELQRIDMSKIDFSEVFVEMAENAAKAAQNLKQSMAAKQKAFSKDNSRERQKHKQEYKIPKVKEGKSKKSQGGFHEDISY